MSLHIRAVDDDPLILQVEEIERHGGTQFDPEVVRAWVQLAEEVDPSKADALSLIR